MEKQQINIDLRKTTPVSCTECGNETFTEGLYLRKISKFLIGAEQDSLYPIPAFICAKCGHVNDEFVPKMMKGLDEKQA